jgi:hypothetical protein
MLCNAIVSSLPWLRLSFCFLIVQVPSARMMTSSTQPLCESGLETIQDGAAVRTLGDKIAYLNTVGIDNFLLSSRLLLLKENS